MKVKGITSYVPDGKMFGIFLIDYAFPKRIFALLSAPPAAKGFKSILC